MPVINLLPLYWLCTNGLNGKLLSFAGSAQKGALERQCKRKRATSWSGVLVFFLLLAAVPVLVTMGMKISSGTGSQLWAQSSKPLSEHTALVWWPLCHGPPDADTLHHPASGPAPRARTPTVCPHTSLCLSLALGVFPAHQSWLWFLVSWPQFTFTPRAVFSMDH